MNQMEKDARLAFKLSDTTDESTSGSGPVKKEITQGPTKKTDEDMQKDPKDFLNDPDEEKESDLVDGEIDEAKWADAKEKATSQYGYSQDNPRYWKIVETIYETLTNPQK